MTEMSTVTTRLRQWWRPAPVITTTDKDEWGYGTVTITTKSTVPSRWRHRMHRRTPVTMHLGFELEDGSFYEVDSWSVSIYD